MSQRNVEIMRTALDAFNRRDGDAFGALLDEHAEIVPVRAALEGVTFRGVGAGAQYCAAADETWGDLRWEIREIRDGDEPGAQGRGLGRVRDVCAPRLVRRSTRAGTAATGARRLRTRCTALGPRRKARARARAAPAQRCS